MQNRLPILRIQFKNRLLREDIPAFRGAINDIVGRENTLLFHNHTENGFRFSYPLIQYKRIQQKATIVCIGEGTEEIGKLFATCNFNIQLANERIKLEVDKIHADKTLIQVWDDKFEYNLRKWLPLNQENYNSYTRLDSIAERYAMLERLLIGNILSFAKGVGITIDKNIIVNIKEVTNERRYFYKGIKMQGFDIAFSSNVTLPDFIGLGHGVSMGFGMTTRRHNIFNENKDN